MGPCICACQGCMRAKGLSNRVMPAQRPGKSIQIVGTPWELIDAVEARFGKIEFDLAATADNCKVREFGKVNPFKRFGPGSKRGEDALIQDWAALRGNKWLNPEFGDIKSYAAKCFMTLSEKPKGSIFLLIPASVGSNWWRDYIDGRARAHFLNPRVTFQGHTASYPKDLALIHYGGKPGYEVWPWKK